MGGPSNSRIRGYPANVGYIRKRYIEATGADWLGTDFHLKMLIRESGKPAEVLAKMAQFDTFDLPDDPRYRALGEVSDADLRDELYKRRELKTKPRKPRKD